jgi:hypothetical protein
VAEEGSGFTRTRSERLRKIGFEAGMTQARPDGRKTTRKVGRAARWKEIRNPVARSEFRFKKRRGSSGGK